MPLDPGAEAALIAAVREAAREEILPRFRDLTPEDIAAKSRPDDLVTVADRAAEARLPAAARKLLPGVAVVGEEAVAENPRVRDQIDTCPACLIIDPIDGTWNFAHGLATFGVILAFAEHGRTTWAMIYDPVADEWAIARDGGGAELVRAGGARRVLRFGQEAACDVGRTMGYVHAYLFKGEERRRVFSRLHAFHKTDALRCSAHEYRLMAQGAVDFCFSPMLNPWDHAAGALIATEAGGVARLLDGTDYTPGVREGRLLVAKSQTTWDAVAAVFDGI